MAVKIFTFLYEAEREEQNKLKNVACIKREAYSSELDQKRKLLTKFCAIVIINTT